MHRFFFLGLIATGCNSDTFASADGAAHDDGATSEGGAPDSQPIGEGGGMTDAPSSPCPSLHGPTMVRVTTSDQSFCIDTTEVSVKQYGEFLTAKAGNTSGQPPFCAAWNSTYALPSISACAIDPIATPDLPANCVDWCDAYAYCAWAGKRLCGDEKGAMLDVAQASTKHDEWYVACSHNDDGVHLYPYGSAFDGTKCNSAGSGGIGLTNVGSKPGCEGGYAGLLDMSGNIDEWDMTCRDWNSPVSDGGAASITCMRRGGSWYPPSNTAYLGQCNSALEFKRQDPGGGIRCCAD